MARDETKRLKGPILQADEKSFSALLSIREYAPSNPACSIEAISAAHDIAVWLRKQEADAMSNATRARERAVVSEWEFHNLMLKAKDSVVAQFGNNSDEVAKLGLKKKSEYKSPGRKAHRESAVDKNE